jgi:hypothetical protein
LHADRNAHFYVLDRTNGKFLSGTPFAYQNWNKGFDENGRPIPVPGSNSSAQGSFLVYPTLIGGTNYQSPSYSPLTGWLYLEYQEAGQQFMSSPATIERGRQYIGRAPGRGAPPARGPNDPAPNSGVKAIDPETGKTVWDFKTYQGSATNGVLATGGGVLFVSGRDGNGSGMRTDGSAFRTGGNAGASGSLRSSPPSGGFTLGRAGSGGRSDFGAFGRSVRLASRTGGGLVVREFHHRTLMHHTG